MAYFEDLSPCNYERFNPARRHLVLSVGWLERGHSFPQGNVTSEFLEALASLIAIGTPNRFVRMGYHTCDLCPPGTHRTPLYPKPKFPVHSHRNLFIPYQGRLYVSPESIGHYITVHKYLPPVSFIEAVLDCPPVHSDAYCEQTWRFFRLTSEDLGPVPAA